MSFESIIDMIRKVSSSEGLIAFMEFNLSPYL